MSGLMAGLLAFLLFKGDVALGLVYVTNGRMTLRNCSGDGEGFGCALSGGGWVLKDSRMSWRLGLYGGEGVIAVSALTNARITQWFWLQATTVSSIIEFKLYTELLYACCCLSFATLPIGELCQKLWQREISSNSQIWKALGGYSPLVIS